MSTFIRQQDNQSKRSARVLSVHRGNHFGYSPTDQGGEYAFSSDLEPGQNRLRLRPGMRKVEEKGYPKTTEGLFPMSIVGVNLLGLITGAQSLVIYRSEDVAEGVQKYYTWDEINNTFTWDEVNQKTWEELLTGG